MLLDHINALGAWRLDNRARSNVERIMRQFKGQRYRAGNGIDGFKLKGNKIGRHGVPCIIACHSRETLAMRSVLIPT